MPVLENSTSNKESFLYDYPLLHFNQITKVPILMGMNSGEGGIYASREL